MRLPVPLLGVFLVVTGRAQCPPGAPRPGDLALRTTTPAARGPADVRWQMARSALAAGKADEARQHLLAALTFHPDSPALLLDLVQAASADADQLALWSERFVRAAADAKGRFSPDAATKKAMPSGKRAEAAFAAARELASLRAQAVAELVQAIERERPDPRQPNAARSVLVRWFAELLFAIADQAPAMLRSTEAGLGEAIAAFHAEPGPVVAGLLRIVQQGAPRSGSGPATGAAPLVLQDRAVRAARLLLGIERQAGFRDLRGEPPPDLGAPAAEARRLLAAIEAAPAEAARVWSIEELERLGPEAAEAFTARHRHWRCPGIALSPTGRYRIETVCGHETLLGVARTIELHHARLVAHFGQDPFAGRQGVVRIVPEHGDLETEGSPFWWAGGFQAGDRTVLRFAWGDVPGLGHGLTHELTHRFDSVLRPFLGAWYKEGHASWTAGHYAKVRDADFVDDHLDLGSVARTAGKGYGGKEQFARLLRGEVEDYRDNYFAGYALYAFLRGHPPKQMPRYRGALERYERTARGGRKDPVGWFTDCFCDGEQGRPASFDGFVAEWQAFLGGVVAWLDERPEGHEWVGRYGGLGPRDPGGLVHDAPTWSWARLRAEPWFGQDHAALATALLEEAGETEAAVAAGLWSFAVDGWRPQTARAVAAGLAARAPAAAFATAALARERFPGFAVAGAPPPLRKVHGYAAALAERARALAEGGAGVAAAALAAEP
ncbi:MAG: hypothetical protein FJ265_18060, partial [Planctomycetes bacterium]|nr:hypothetical protein [Planctomycetota bacterium]